ncbi:LysR family transcriptional regulator [Xylophilus rhododendri]|nr:LysR substrate-binding domain-containing protein [Xylophilus rhododendri]
MIEAFRAAILHGGISAGADALGIPQPSMSRVIAELQKAVGFALFLKHGRTIKPTAEALALMAKVQQSFMGLEEISRFSEQLRKQRMGRLSICTIPSVGHSVMPEIIEQLRAEYPDVMVSMRIASYMEVWRNVRNRQADIGITADILSAGELETVAEFSGECVCIGTSRWLDAGASHVELEELATRPFIGLTDTFQRQMDGLMSAHGLQLDPVVEVSASHSASELVLRGMGISVVDPLTGRRHRELGGVTLPLRPSFRYSVYATAMADTRLGEPARALLGQLTKAIGKARTHAGGE